MVTAIVILVVFVVGVLVLFVLLARRQGRPRDDLWGDWMRRHRLSAGEAGDVSDGVSRGRQFTDPRLRAAAVDWAGAMLRTDLSGRATVVLLGLYLGLAALAIIRLPEDVNWVVLAIWTAFSVVILRRRRRVERSFEINRDAAPPA